MDGRAGHAGVLADIVAEAVEGIDRGHSAARTLATGLGEALRADSSSYGWLDLDAHQGALHAWPDVPDVELMMHATTMMPMAHPVLGHWLSGHSDVAVVSSLITDWRGWRGSEAYSLLKRGLGCTETAGIRLRDPHHTLRMIGVCRARDFTPDEVRFIEDLGRPAVVICAHDDWLNAFVAQGPTAAAARRSATAIGLTTREFQVLQLLATGLTASSMAARLSISTRTVHRHLGNVYAKLDTHDRLTTVMVAQRAGILQTQAADN